MQHVSEKTNTNKKYDNVHLLYESAHLLSISKKNLSIPIFLTNIFSMPIEKEVVNAKHSLTNHTLVSEKLLNNKNGLFSPSRLTTEQRQTLFTVEDSFYFFH